MIYGYARVSTDGQSVAAQVQQLTAAGCAKVFREVASGAARPEPGPTAQVERAPATGGIAAQGRRRASAGDRPQLCRERQHHLEARSRRTHAAPDRRSETFAR